MKRFLILEDGTVFPGQAIGAAVNTTGELVLYTGATGYQEAITNKSYTGQIIGFTYPQQGAVGINRDDYETIEPTIKGVVLGESYQLTSHWRAQMTLDQFLRSKRIPGLQNVDTRRLYRHLAIHGNMKASLMDTHDAHAHDQIKALVVANNQVSQVSTKQAYPSPNIGRNVVVLDLGLKNTVLRELSKRQCNVTVLPFDTASETIETIAPDGILISDGPGDPQALTKTITMLKEIQGHYPIFAIGLGFSIMALVNDVSVETRQFARHSINLVVKEKITQNISFTAQNGNYGLTTIPADSNLLTTHLAVNHQEVLGFRHRFLPVFAVNFDPEAAAGPTDAQHLFDDFLDLMNADIERKQRVF
ncbi:carbamoyl phosphate synthase small subunit [Lapidilactobacillus luobeiensis]|uniref:carbamoyl phosphate synthase small subunit n=1 Tax=Lapidilactobacillus luobeiensis TaxID=2950371 RepID=UPI0021C34703|nr:carbamoyl phosphate synthase small subunit [Lapidilactobacillus luobeiensis]